MSGQMDAASLALTGILLDVAKEIEAADAWPPHNSAHESFCVLLEEVEELKAHVFTNQKRRDPEAMRKEAVQVAAMAVRLIRDVIDGGRIRI
jgi:hypothetical protein